MVFEEGTFLPPCVMMPASQGLSVDPEDISNPSLVDDEGRFYSQSIRSSVVDYVYANGRRYHAYRAGSWIVPNDESEQDRMDLLHHVWKTCLGGECLKFANKVERIERVLDIGTGTGLWAVEMADEYPSATVIGIDLSPIQPGWTPPNCYFFVDDAEQAPWEFEEKFDVVHLRSMEAAFSDWRTIYQQAFENLRPGGIIENQAQEARIYSLDKELPEAVSKWQNLLISASRSFGRAIDIARQYKGWIEAAGFEEVHEVVYKVPMGPWAKQDKALAEVYLGTVLDGVEAYSLQVFTQQLGMSLEEAKAVIGDCQRAIMDMSNHLYANLRVLVGKKPS